MQVSEAGKLITDRVSGELIEERVQQKVERLPEAIMDGDNRLGNVPEMRDVRPVVGDRISSF